jgi:hypothetical protein
VRVDRPRTPRLPALMSDRKRRSRAVS